MTRATVLVLEDEDSLAALYADWLAEYDLRTAHSADEALDLLDDDVDVALLDRRLPDGSGDAVLDEIRRRDVGCRVAMVTAVVPDFDVAGMGFDDYVVKPVDRAGLQAAVERLLALRSYDEGVRAFFRVSRKLAALESAKSSHELADSEAYDALVERRDRLRGELDDVVVDFDGEPGALFRTAGPARPA